MKHIHFLTSFKKVASFFSALAALVYLVGCGEHGHDHSPDHGHSQGNDHGHAHDDHGAAISITQYTDKSELFMEHEPLVEDVSTELIIHLTRTSDFTPITRGSLEVRVISASGQTYSIIDDAPARDGIFLPVVSVPFTDTARMELRLKSSQLEDVQILENVEVHAPGYHPPHEEEEAEDPNAISFLKEQQWKIEYALEQVQSRLVYQAVLATGTLSLPASGEAVLPSPASGLVRFANGSQLETGIEVSQGEILFVIDPDASWQAGLAKLSEDYQLAKAELDRVNALQEQNAVSKRRIQEAEIRLQTLTTALRQMGGEAALDGSANLQARAKTPLDGLISEIYVKPGQRVEAGQALALVINSDSLILDAQTVPSRLEKLGPITDATFRPSGSSRVFSVSEMGGHVVSNTPLAVSGSNLASVRFHFDNPDRQFIAGTRVSVQLLGGEASSDGVAIPVAAIQEEEGIPIVYVQTEGETVEKRYPKLGANDGSYTQALSGIEAGERVVTKGATFIRLSTLSTSEMGHGHAH